MERKFLEELGLEKEAIDKIMAENGKDIEAQKALTLAESEKLKKATETISQLQDTVKQFDGIDVEKLKSDAGYLFEEKTDDTKLKASSGADHQNPPNQKKVERSSYYKLKSFSRSC